MISTRAAARPDRRLALSVQDASGDPALPARSTLRRWILRALERDATVTVRFVGRAEGRTLNRLFRDRDYATNVLTFVYDDNPVGAGNGARRSARAGMRSGSDVATQRVASPTVKRSKAVSGDLVLCVPVLKREAKAQGKTLREHCAHLVIHGTLHLQGYDHGNDKDATVMEALETRLLAALGYRDPYVERR